MLFDFTDYKPTAPKQHFITRVTQGLSKGVDDLIDDIKSGNLPIGFKVKNVDPTPESELLKAKYLSDKGVWKIDDGSSGVMPSGDITPDTTMTQGTVLRTKQIRAERSGKVTTTEMKPNIVDMNDGYSFRYRDTVFPVNAIIGANVIEHHVNEHDLLSNDERQNIYTDKRSKQTKDDVKLMVKRSERYNYPEKTKKSQEYGYKNPEYKRRESGYTTSGYSSNKSEYRIPEYKQPNPKYQPPGYKSPQYMSQPLSIQNMRTDG